MSEIKTRNDIENVFVNLLEHLNSDHDAKEEIRNAVKDLEQIARSLVTKIQSIHNVAPETESISSQLLCQNIRTTLVESVQEQYKAIGAKIPAGQYYRFCDHWKFVTQRLCFVSALLIYFESAKLASKDEVADLLGLARKADAASKTFHLDLEDYLHGLLQLGSELSRYAVNRVTAGDYRAPLAIAKFIGELDAGFRLLNLKNDNLRKRFDGLKYDLKKCEEVVYDITLRGLVPRSGDIELKIIKLATAGITG